MKSYQEILDQIAKSIADVMEVESGAIDIHTRFEEFGLASAEAVMVVGDLEDFLEMSLPVEVFYKHPTAAQLAKFLLDMTRAKEAV